MNKYRDVAVLYVDPRGPYPELVEQWYDEARDALRYAGRLPVVAHPPCGPWSGLKHLSRHDDPSHGPYAVAVVQTVGGVLEHPAHSRLFRHCGLPHPGELPDKYGGVTYEVDQCDWGHVARKKTWIYVVGAKSIPTAPSKRKPTHWVSGGHKRVGRKSKSTSAPPGIKICSAQQRRRTPRAFAEFLIAIARSAGWS
ncbi:MAG: hypothetical protein FWD73_07060 [Polyangiaceae bacterium]|nr:hypothetical protein [Polyangiaceae bacterium]